MGNWLMLMLRLLRGQFGRCEAEKNEVHTRQEWVLGPT